MQSVNCRKAYWRNGHAGPAKELRQKYKYCMKSVPTIRRFLVGAVLLATSIAGQFALRRGANIGGGAALLLGAIGFAALFWRTGGSHLEEARRIDWRRWDARLLMLLLAAAAAFGLAALFMLDVSSPDAHFWQLYGASLILALAGPPVAFFVGRNQAPARTGSMWRTLALLAAMIGVAATLRLYRLSDLPFGFWYDEAANGLEALRVANEPQYQPVYTDGVNATGHYLYLIVAAFESFGVSAHSIRLVSAVMGIATVAAAYLAARELYGAKAAILAAALFAVARWSITFSRLGMYNISTPLFELLAVAFLLRAYRRNHPSDFALAGLSLGFGLCFYPAFHLFAAAVGLLLAALILRRAWAVWVETRPASDTGGTSGLTERLRSVFAYGRMHLHAMLGPVVIAGCVIIVIAPVLTFALERPESYFARVQGTSLLSNKEAGERLPALSANLRKHLLMFNVRGDPNGRHNLPGEPMLDPVTGALFVAGVALALFRWRQPANLLLPAWLLISLLGGVLSLDFEAPQSLRSIGAMPAALLLAVGPLDALVREWTRGGGRYFPNAVVASLALLMLPVSYMNVDMYFHRQAKDFASWNAHSTPETLTARILNSLGPDTEAYVISLFDQHPTVRFLTRNQASYERLDTTATLPLVMPANADLALILDAERKHLFDDAVSLYPDARREELAAPFGSPTVVYYVHVPAEQLAAIQGWDARYFGSSEEQASQAVTRHEEAIEFDWPNDAPLPQPFNAEWRGVLAAETFGPYQFGLVSPAEAELFIDENLVLSLSDDGPREAATALVLPRGNHNMRVTARSGEGPVQLMWRTPDRETEVLPAHVVYTPPVTNNGLLGRYYPNGEWSGSAALAQIDTRFEMYFHIPPLSRPYTVEWIGKIAIPVSGPYGFGVASVDESVLFVDEMEAARSGGTGDYGQGTVELTDGLHDIRIRYADRTDHTRISVYWIPPTGTGREIIPKQVLFPPQGDYSLVALPEFADLWLSEEAAGKALAGPTAELAAVEVVATDLVGPAGIAVTADGRAIVALPDAGTVAVFDAAGKVEMELSRNGEPFDEPFDVAIGGHGTLYVLDAGAARVSLFDRDLRFVHDLAIDATHAGRARGIHVDGDGVIWLADTSGGVAAGFTQDGSLVNLLPVRRDLAAAGEAQPVDVVSLPDGSIWTTDAGVYKLTAYNSEGMRIRSWDIAEANTRDSPHLAISASGEVYMTEPEAGTVTQYDAQGERTAIYALTPANGSRVKPVGIAVDAAGNVWVTDVDGGRVLRLAMGVGTTAGD